MNSNLTQKCIFYTLAAYTVYLARQAEGLNLIDIIFYFNLFWFCVLQAEGVFTWRRSVRQE